MYLLITEFNRTTNGDNGKVNHELCKLISDFTLFKRIKSNFNNCYTCHVHEFVSKPARINVARDFITYMEEDVKKETLGLIYV